MPLFFKKRRSPHPTPVDNEINQLIQSGLRKLGRHLAAALSRKEQSMSVRSKKIVVALFTLAMTALSMTFFYRGLFVWSSRPPSYFSKPEMSIPVIPHLPDSLLINQQKRTTPPTPHLSPIPDSLIP